MCFHCPPSLLLRVLRPPINKRPIDKRCLFMKHHASHQNKFLSRQFLVVFAAFLLGAGFLFFAPSALAVTCSVEYTYCPSSCPSSPNLSLPDNCTSYANTYSCTGAESFGGAARRYRTTTSYYWGSPSKYCYSSMAEFGCVYTRLTSSSRVDCTAGYTNSPCSSETPPGSKLYSQCPSNSSQNLDWACKYRLCRVSNATCGGPDSGWFNGVICVYSSCGTDSCISSTTLRDRHCSTSSDTCTYTDVNCGSPSYSCSGDTINYCNRGCSSASCFSSCSSVATCSNVTGSSYCSGTQSATKVVHNVTDKYCSSGSSTCGTGSISVVTDRTCTTSYSCSADNTSVIATCSATGGSPQRTCSDTWTSQTCAANQICSAGACIADAAPIVTTTPATSITQTSATLNGTVNPNGYATTAWFRYSTTSPGGCNDIFGTRAPASGGFSAGSGTSALAYPQGISGLTEGNTYYYCAIANNSGGNGYGAILSFLTSSAAPVTLSASLSANPASGSAPFDTTLTTNVVYDGNISDTINYSYWWDCSDVTNSVAGASASCGILPSPAAGSCASNSDGHKCNAVLTNPHSVGNIYASTGSYTAKVIVERGGATPATSSAPISVGVLPPVTGCINECYPPNTNECTTLTSYRTCGEVGDGDACLEWVPLGAVPGATATPCPTGYTCLVGQCFPVPGWIEVPPK